MRKKIITTQKGRQVDIGAIRDRNATTMAVGNAGKNARGDIVGRGGVIVKSAEQITTEYNQSNPRAVQQQSPISLKGIGDEVVMTPRQAVEALTSAAEERNKSAKKTPRQTRDSED